MRGNGTLALEGELSWNPDLVTKDLETLGFFKSAAQCLD